MAILLRMIGISMNAAGALILAWRVKSILDALIMAQHANNINFRVIIDNLNGEQQKVPYIAGMDEQVERQQKRGIKLLVFGFSLICIGNLLVGLSWYLEQ